MWLLLLAGACSKTEAPEPEQAAPVQTVTVRLSPIQRIVRAQGILHPIDQASIIPKINAPVQTFYVNRGDHVKRGQLLAVLENRDLAAAAVEATGNYEQAEANFRTTKTASLPEEITKAEAEAHSTKEALDASLKVYNSRKALFDQGALPRKQLDEAGVAYIQARSQYEVALRHLEALQNVGKEEQVKAAQAQVDAARGRRLSAEAQLAYSRIVSPIDGVVTDQPVYAGEMASQGSPLLTVMNIAKVVARANVSVDLLPFIKVGDPATITLLDSALEYQGKVTVVSPALEPNSTTAEVWVLVPNPGERLRPGLSVQLAVASTTVREAVVIPTAAILPTPEGTGETVLVVGPDSIVYQRIVETGIREGDRVQVLKGLTPGEQVITEGGFGLPDKSKVRVETKGELNKKDQHE